MLRHAPDRIGIALDPQGWTDVATLLAQAAEHGMAISREELDQKKNGCAGKIGRP